MVKKQIYWDQSKIFGSKHFGPTEARIHRAEIIVDLSKIWGATSIRQNIFHDFFLYLIPNYNWRGHLSVDQNSSKLTFKTSESEISSPNLGLSADLDRWDYYFFSSKRSLCLGPKNEMMLLSWHFWCACCPSRFYLARLSFAWFKDAGNLRLIWPTVCVWNNMMSLCNFFPIYWVLTDYLVFIITKKLWVISKIWIHIWHSTFCHFLKIMKHFHWSSQQMQARFVVFKHLDKVILVRFCQKMAFDITGGISFGISC